MTMINAEFTDHIFCQNCTEKIREFIRQPEPKLRANIKPKLTEMEKGSTSGNRTIQKRHTETKTEEPRKRRKLDMGKIMALHSAGWCNRAIREEPDIDMTDSKVGQAIRRYKRKMMEKGNNQGG